MIMKKNANAFTLVELLVVVSIIGVLTTLVAANLNSARERARDAQRKSDLRSIQTALRLYYNDNGEYPAGSGSISGVVWGEEWSLGTTVYMNILPADPLTDQSYSYTYVDDDNYVLKACLENSSDEKGETETDTTWCSGGWRYSVSP